MDTYIAELHSCYRPSELLTFGPGIPTIQYVSITTLHIDGSLAESLMHQVLALQFRGRITQL